MSLFRTRNLLSPRSEMLNVHFPHFLLSYFRIICFSAFCIWQVKGAAASAPAVIR